MELKNIAKALVLAQSEMSNAKKDAKNPFFKSKYADLNSIREACIPALNNNGIVVLQPTITIDSKNYIKTMLLHESGESLEALTEIIISRPNDAQSQGSGITYARRYGLQSLVCIGADDDDGNAASQQPQVKQPAKEKLKPKLKAGSLEKLLENNDLLTIKKVIDAYELTNEEMHSLILHSENLKKDE